MITRPNRANSWPALCEILAGAYRLPEDEWMADVGYDPPDRSWENAPGEQGASETTRPSRSRPAPPEPERMRATQHVVDLETAATWDVRAWDEAQSHDADDEAADDDDADDDDADDEAADDEAADDDDADDDDDDDDADDDSAADDDDADDDDDDDADDDDDDDDDGSLSASCWSSAARS